MTSQYNHQYSQYSHTGLDNQQDYRNSQMFWDAVSITSSDRNSIALSVYHSVPELQYDEHAAMNQAYDRVSQEVLLFPGENDRLKVKSTATLVEQQIRRFYRLVHSERTP